MEKGLATFKDLIIGDRVFQVPIYQRSYSWGTRQWNDLWDDLFYLRSDKAHFFGTLLFKISLEHKKSGVKTFDVYEIIDGQQRTATALILIREIILQLQQTEEAEIDIIEQLDRLREDYLIYKDIYKLELLGDDKEFFRTCIIDDIEYPNEILTASQGRLREAKLFFRIRMQELKSVLSPAEFKDTLLDLKLKIDNMEIIRYEVDNITDAVLIFETVNDRGKTLTNIEKTKSAIMRAIYLSSADDPSDYLNRVNNCFANIFRWFEAIRNTRFGKYIKEDDIQRYHFIIYEMGLRNRRKTSYKYMDFIKNKLGYLYRSNPKKCLDYALDYTKDLERAFFTLKEITSFSEASKIGELINMIFTLDRVANFFPLLIAIWIRYKEKNEGPETAFSKIENISFRVYAVGRKRADTGEGWLYDLAHQVHRQNMEHNAVIEELNEIRNDYQNDQSFKKNLEDDDFFNRVSSRDKRYLLFEYERFLRREAREPLDIKLEDVLSPEFSVEHIWASDPSKLGLTEDLLEIHEQYRDKLGNLTMASRSWNSKWGNEPFETKRKEYGNSILRVQQDLSDLKMWGKAQIEKRETKIIDFSVKRWSQ